MSSLKDVREEVSSMHWLAKVAICLGVLIVVALIGLLSIRVTSFTFVDNYQFAYIYDYWGGEQYAVGHNGYIFAPFWLKAVHTIDLRPMQVSMSSIQRVLNAKLVHFDPYTKDSETGLPGWQLFIKWHGRNDYEGPGITGQAGKNSFQEILMNYAYDGTGRSYPFLVIEKELKGDAVVVLHPAVASKYSETKQ